MDIQHVARKFHAESAVFVYAEKGLISLSSKKQLVYFTPRHKYLSSFHPPPWERGKGLLISKSQSKNWSESALFASIKRHEKFTSLEIGSHIALLQ